MYNSLPPETPTVPGVKLSPWTKVPNAPYCSMRFIEGLAPASVASRVAFIEKTPRVRVRMHSENVAITEDYKNWHEGCKGDGGWDAVSQGWCDAQLLEMGYVVPDPRPFDDSML